MKIVVSVCAIKLARDATNGAYCIWAKEGRFVIFPVLCLLGYENTALKSYLLLAFGAHKTGCQDGIFRAVFPSIRASWDPPNTAKQGKTQNDKSTLFYPPTGAYSKQHPVFSSRPSGLQGQCLHGVLPEDLCKKDHSAASAAEWSVGNPCTSCGQLLTCLP